jgi:hypothetical protein
MDSSPMDISLSSPQSTPSNPAGPNIAIAISNASLYGSMNPINRVLSNSSPTSTAPHLRSRTRRPSSLSLGLNFDRIKSFGLSNSSPSSGGGGGGASAGGIGGSLLPAANIGVLETGNDNTLAGRGRASSTASSMSLGFSPSRRSTSLEDSQRQDQVPGEQTNRTPNENEETPQARKPSRLGQMAASLKRRRQVIGISGNNGSESSLSARSDGGRTPDTMYGGYLQGNMTGFAGPRGLEGDVDALVVDTNARPPSTKDMPMTPPKSATALETSPFSTENPVRTSIPFMLNKMLILSSSSNPLVSSSFVKN